MNNTKKILSICIIFVSSYTYSMDQQQIEGKTEEKKDAHKSHSPGNSPKNKRHSHHRRMPSSASESSSSSLSSDEVTSVYEDNATSPVMTSASPIASSPTLSSSNSQSITSPLATSASPVFFSSHSPISSNTQSRISTNNYSSSELPTDMVLKLFSNLLSRSSETIGHTENTLSRLNILHSLIEISLNASLDTNIRLTHVTKSNQSAFELLQAINAAQVASGKRLSDVEEMVKSSLNQLTLMGTGVNKLLELSSSPQQPRELKQEYKERKNLQPHHQKPIEKKQPRLQPNSRPRSRQQQAPVLQLNKKICTSDSFLNFVRKNNKSLIAKNKAQNKATLEKALLLAATKDPDILQILLIPDQRPSPVASDKSGSNALADALHARKHTNARLMLTFAINNNLKIGNQKTKNSLINAAKKVNDGQEPSLVKLVEQC